MSCAHCCYSTNQNGNDMEIEMFKEILDKWSDVINKNKYFIILGGGEPTLHPKFWEILEMSKLYGSPWVATNGSNKEVSLELCKMGKKGEINAILSLDKWHDPIDNEVIEKFKEGLSLHHYGRYKLWLSSHRQVDKREIRIILIPLRGGRANELSCSISFCPCPGIQIKPDGNIFSCGCDGAPIIGNVEKGIIDKEYKYYDVFRGCYKKVNVLIKGG